LPSSEKVQLKGLRDKRYASVLCYPRYSAREASKRISELRQLGVKALEFTGEKTAFNVPVLGKGCVGIVVKAHTKTDRVALKIRRVDADRNNMEHEAKMLAKANSIGVGPQMVARSEDFLLMEFVDGSLLPQWVTGLKGKGSKNRVRKVLRDILEQCWRLDQVGLDHGELSRAPKHIIVDAHDNVRILDFETASIWRRTSNVTAVSQYLFIGSQLARKLHRRLGKVDEEALIESLRDYKSEHTRQNLERILETCALA